MTKNRKQYIEQYSELIRKLDPDEEPKWSVALVGYDHGVSVSALGTNPLRIINACFHLVKATCEVLLANGSDPEQVMELLSKILPAAMEQALEEAEEKAAAQQPVDPEPDDEETEIPEEVLKKLQELFPEENEN